MENKGNKKLQKNSGTILAVFSQKSETHNLVLLISLALVFFCLFDYFWIRFPNKLFSSISKNFSQAITLVGAVFMFWSINDNDRNKKISFWAGLFICVWGIASWYGDFRLRDPFPFVTSEIIGNNVRLHIHNGGDRELLLRYGELRNIKIEQEILGRINSGESDNPDEINNSVKRVFRIRMVLPGEDHVIGSFPLEEDESHLSLRFGFTTSAGGFSQVFSLARTGSGWIDAWKINANGVVKSSTPVEFPRLPDGSIRW